MNRYLPISKIISFLLFVLLTGCKKKEEQVLPVIGIPEAWPSIELWPSPSNHPLIGTSVKIKILHSDTDSIKINGKLWESKDFYIYTGPVRSTLKYVAAGYGYGKVVKDSILIIPVSNK